MFFIGFLVFLFMFCFKKNFFLIKNKEKLLIFQFDVFDNIDSRDVQTIRPYVGCVNCNDKQ